MLKLCIDPGHGGADRGAVSPDGVLVEADYTMSLARFLAARVKHSSESIEVGFTRSRDDESVTLTERGQRSRDQGADLVLCLHVNAGPVQLHGGMTFYWPSNIYGQEIADHIQRSFPKPLYYQTRGPIPATDDKSPGDDWLRRARNVLAPHRATAVLVEVGFLSNPVDLAALLEPAIQSGIVAALMCGLATARHLQPPPRILAATP